MIPDSWVAMAMYTRGAQDRLCTQYPVGGEDIAHFIIPYIISLAPTPSI